MSDIKSAFEIANEKIKNLSAVTEEERMKWKYIPEGERLAARYLEEDCNLLNEIKQYDKVSGQYVRAGASEILIRYIMMPKDDLIIKRNKYVMEGIKDLKVNKIAVENVYSNIRRIFSHYTEQGEQQRKQAYESLKNEFETKMQQIAQQQLGIAMTGKINVERQPQFQEEWRKLQNQIDSQYLQLLNEYKKELSGIL
ncbi:MAG: hypothetical protein PHQ86_05095 [Dehalococcoidales bacterium]|nr:hypothetical protein [Dehalococcoidales bacterium]